MKNEITFKEDRIVEELFKDAESIRNLNLACKSGTTDWDLFSARGKIMATLFFEPSTRTRLSFEAAMKKLGGEVIGLSSTDSSLVKGESMEDTLNAISMYADVLVVRSSSSIKTWGDPNCIVINAGDGGENHPTQSLLDGYTIWRYKKSLSNMTIGIVGDLGNSRTIKSLVEFMSKKRNIFTTFDSTGLGNKINNDHVEEIYNIEDIKEFESEMFNFDVLYLNRVQNERNGIACESKFILQNNHLNDIKNDCLIMNPGPRKEEIPANISDSRIKMWEQVENGFYIRMALLRYAFGKNKNLA